MICPGVKPSQLSSNIVHHLIPKSVDTLFHENMTDANSFPHQEYWRTCGCMVLCENEKQCDSCYQYSHKCELSQKAKQRKLDEPAHLFSPVSQTAPERIKLTLQMQRLKCAELEQKLEEMKSEIHKSSVEVDNRVRTLPPFLVTLTILPHSWNCFGSSRKSFSPTAPLESENCRNTFPCFFFQNKEFETL